MDLQKFLREHAARPGSFNPILGRVVHVEDVQGAFQGLVDEIADLRQKLSAQHNPGGSPDAKALRNLLDKLEAGLQPGAQHNATLLSGRVYRGHHIRTIKLAGSPEAPLAEALNATWE